MMSPAMSDASYGLRLALLRAALFAAVCTGVALFGHTAAGAPAPLPGVVAGYWALVALAAFPFARGRRSIASLAPGLFGAQLLLHMGFSAATSPLPGAGPLSVEHLCGSAAVHADFGMLAAHIWAALVTGWWLSSGEEALWAVLRLLRARLPVRGKAGALPPPAPSLPVEPPRAFLTTRFLRHTLAGRAPPPRAPRPCATAA